VGKKKRRGGSAVQEYLCTGAQGFRLAEAAPLVLVQTPGGSEVFEKVKPLVFYFDLETPTGSQTDSPGIVVLRPAALTIPSLHVPFTYGETYNSKRAFAGVGYS
jgi:hypothetical protein